MHCQRSRFKQKVKKPEDEMLQAFFMEEENADNYRSHLCFFIFDSWTAGSRNRMDYRKI